MQPAATLPRAARAGVRYFALVFAAGVAFGLVRVPVLVPLFGARTAELMEMPFMLVVVLLAAQHVVTRFALPASGVPRLVAGFVALGLLLGGEWVLLAVRRIPVADYIASRDPVSGGVY